MGTELPTPSRWVLVGRALRRRCPCCGGGGLFEGWFTMVPRCPTCGLASDRVVGDGDVVVCDFGGTMTYAPGEAGTDVTLDACEFTDGLPISGSGSTDDDAGTFAIDITSGVDSIHYERDAEGGLSVIGRYDGATVRDEAAPPE